MVRIFATLLRRFGADRRGASLLLFALTIIPLLVGIGLSIDYGRSLMARHRLSLAIDAAALAAGSWPDLTEQQIEAKVMDYFRANFPPDTDANPDSIDVVKTDDRITVTATGHVETILLHFAGFQKIDVSAYTEVALKQTKVELVMVLDNTGSMSWNGKLSALKGAATTLVDILKPGSGAPANSEEVKIGLVPFAAAVNIGADTLNSGWIDTQGQSSLAGEDFQSGVNVLDLFDQINNRSWNGCVRARPEPFDTQDDAPVVGTPDSLWVPYFAPDEPDFWWYANRYASDSGYSGGYWNYDARQRFTGKYASLTVPGWNNDGPDFNCLVRAVTPLTQTKSDILSGIDEMIASGSTVIPAGLAWGWRLISPTEPFTQGAAYDDDVAKAIILLTDGRNDVGGGLGTHNRSYYSAYGFARAGHLGAANGWQAESVLNDKTSALCSNIKARGIRLYTITFQLSDGPIKDLMRDCATQPAMYYDSPSNSQLETAFEDIAKGLNDLRLSK